MVSASVSVGSTRSPISSATVFLKKNDLPRSPRRRLPSQIDELRQDRPVEAETDADQRDLLGVGVVAGDDRRRIAGRQAQHQEDEDGDDHHDRDGCEQAAQDVGEH